MLTRANRVMNRMIMDYLVKHGYSQAATDFAMESGVNMGVDLTTIEQRKRIKNAIYAGHLEIAIEEINDIDATVCQILSLSLIFAMIILVSCTTHSLRALMKQ